MRVLLDNNVNQRFARLIDGHEVIHARQMRWGSLQNGRLIAAAEEGGFDVLVTADKNMRYEQNLAGRRITVVVLNSLFIKWADIRPLAPQVQLFLDGVPARGSFVVIDPPTD